MALSSTSTLPEVQAAYINNSDYDLEGSVAKCKDFIRACRILLLLIPKRVSHGGQGADGIEFDPLVLQASQDKAIAWLRSNDATAGSAGGGGGVVFADFGDFRRECY